jgi:hypothetical protein
MWFPYPSTRTRKDQSVSGICDKNNRLYSRQVLVGWLIGDHLLLRAFGPYGIIFMTMCVYCLRFSRHSWRAIYLSFIFQDKKKSDKF